MGKFYSADLRQRVQGHIETGHSRRDASRRFGVSPSFAVKLAQRVAATGSTAPSPQGRPPGGGKLAPHMGRLIAWVEAQPDITLAELAAKLAETNSLRVNPASLSRVLAQAGFTYKKNASGIGMRTRGRRAGSA